MLAAILADLRGMGTARPIFFQGSETPHSILGNRPTTNLPPAAFTLVSIGSSLRHGWRALRVIGSGHTRGSRAAARPIFPVLLALRTSEVLVPWGDEVQSFGTVRYCLGVAFERMLVYGTGGAAFTDVRSSLGLDCVPSGCGANGNPTTATTESSTRRTGWIAGAGIERLFGQNWLIRAEYLHDDFGNLSNTLLLPLRNCFDNRSCGLSRSRNIHFDTVRLGLSYKFSGF